MPLHQFRPVEEPGPPPKELSAERIRALFDILTHYETYDEITSFKRPGAITNYGFPFRKTAVLPTTPMVTAPSTPRVRTPVSFFTASDAGKSSSFAVDNQYDDDDDDQTAPSSSPILQLLLTRILLPLPGVQNLSKEFWSVSVQSILVRLGEAELSESYDKGAMGTRKVLATGSSAILEMLGRGLLGGVDKREMSSTATYDHGSADDLERAWQDVIQSLVYGDLVNQLFDHFTRSDNLETLSPTIEASARHNVLHLATLVHQVFILSPEGQYLLKLIENVHSLIPYKMLKQTLRIGNAATMISGMVRILLAKLSVTSVTNWFGLTQNADDGMNLLQRIISLVLSWDASEFKKSAEKIEKAKNGPTDEMLRLIKEYIADSRSEHDTVRRASEMNSQSIITAIFNASNPSLCAQLTESQHLQCLEYYSALLSVRDRDCITSAICRQPPDVFTRAIKDVVAAYEPIIRTVHSNVDLREHFEALQGFIEEFIRASRPKRTVADSSEERVAGVEDYVDLLMRNRGLLYKWIHAVASQCPDLWETFREWANDMICKFRKTASDSLLNASHKSQSKSADIVTILNKLYGNLDETTQRKILSFVDVHATFLESLNVNSRMKMQVLVSELEDTAGRRDTMCGPGEYLERWQCLLDDTPITPAQPEGPIRHGNEVKHTTTMGKTGTGGKKLERDPRNAVERPDVQFVVDTLGASFKGEIQEAVRWM